MKQKIPPSAKQQTLTVAVRQSTVVSKHRVNAYYKNKRAQGPYRLSKDQSQSVPLAKTMYETGQDNRYDVQKNIEAALIQLIPPNFNSVLIGMAVLYYIQTKDITLLATLLGVTSGPTLLPEVKNLMHWIVSLKKISK